MKESRERLFFIDEVRKSITLDHNRRHAKGLEGARFVRGAFEKELESRYPQVGTSELLNTAKKAVASIEKDPGLNRGMDFDKVDGLMKFVFNDKDPNKWPTLVALVKNYAEGKFAHYADAIHTEEEREVEKMVVALGDTSDKPTHLKLLSLYTEEAVKYYLLNKSQMQTDEEKIKALEKREANLLATLRKLHTKLTANKNLSKEDEKELERILLLLE